MKREYLFYILLSSVVLIIVVGLIYFDSREIVEDQQNTATESRVAPDGKIYDVMNKGIIYTDEYYDEDYGHFEDLVGESFEHVKPSYYESIDFTEVLFPVSTDMASMLPAFIALDTVKYTHIPEDIMSKYFVQEEMDRILYYEKNGIEVNGEQFPADKDEPPVYHDILIIRDTDDVFQVLYSTTYGAYTRYFRETSDGKYEEINKGGW